MIHYLNISSEPCAQKYVIKTLPRTFYHCFSFVSTQIVQIKLKIVLKNKKFIISNFQIPFFQDLIFIYSHISLAVYF